VFLIGSSMDCDLVLGDPLVPAVHSYVLVTTCGVRFRHLGEVPAVRVNGQLVEVSQLADQDQIEIGPFSFLVRLAWPDTNRDLLSLTAAVPRASRPGLSPDPSIGARPRDTAQIRRRRI
jgi:pSer/pThr/pTyr-binding forkhead associated (FHA) protein